MTYPVTVPGSLEAILRVTTSSKKEFSLRQLSNCLSNHKTGDGYADLMFTSPDQDTGVVIEIKRCQTPQEIIPAAQAALEQIQAKRYIDELLIFDCRGFGIAFCRKACVVTMADLTPGN